MLPVTIHYINQLTPNIYYLYLFYNSAELKININNKYWELVG